MSDINRNSEIDIGLRQIINQYQKEISYYSQMQLYGVTAYEKKYQQNLIEERTEEFIKQIEQYMVNTQQNEESENMEEHNEEGTPEDGNPMNENQMEEPAEVKTFTLEELAAYDGKEGRPSYVAVNGTVYDLSAKIPWTGGAHFGLQAGNDLTKQFMGCHRGMTSMLEQLPKVGVLESS